MARNRREPGIESRKSWWWIRQTMATQCPTTSRENNSLKFIVIAGPSRSGITFLTNLLHQAQDIEARRVFLGANSHCRRPIPETRLRRLAITYRAPACAIHGHLQRCHARLRVRIADSIYIEIVGDHTLRG